PRLGREAVQERLAGQPEVRQLVVGRDATLVSPPQRGGAPVRLALRRELVGAARRIAAGEDDRRARARCRDQFLRDERCNLFFVVGADELDPVQRHASPSASSRERSIAAWIAFRNAARTPARSSSRIALIVVPPGEVTCSRSSTGCTCSSRRSFAVPSIVCTTSWV